MVTDKIPLLTLANPFFVVNLYTEYVLKEVKVGGSAGGTGRQLLHFLTVRSRDHQFSWS